MKKVVFALMTVILFTISCEKESFTESDPTDQVELKKATVKVPFKGWYSLVPDASVGTVVCSPEEMGIERLAGGFMQGHETHGGKLKTELSIWKNTGCDFNPELYRLTICVEGRHTVANGDYYFYTGILYTNVADGTITGEIIMDDGVGKYEGVKAKLSITGFHNLETGESAFTTEGYCIFVKK